MNRCTSLAVLVAGVALLSPLSAQEPRPDSMRLPPAADLPGSRTVGEATYRAQVDVIHRTPPVLRVTAGGLQAGQLPPGECVVGLRLSRTGARARTVWTTGPASSGACTGVAGVTFLEIPVPEILGDSLPRGRYHATTVLHLPEDTLEIPTESVYLYADSLPPVRDLGLLRFEAETHLRARAPTRVVTSVRAQNTGERRRVRFEFGHCALRLSAYRTVERTGEPVWRSEAAGDPRNPDMIRICPAILYGTVLSPGEAFSPEEFQKSVPVYEILGDSLPTGRYYFTAQLELLDDSKHVSGWADTLRLEAGSAALTGAEAPLPSVRTLDGLRYQASTTRTSPDTLRASVTVENVSQERQMTSVARDCPLIVYAYRDEERRDAVPLLEPTWRGSGCRLHWHRFALGPGESWTFDTDMLEREIVEEAGRGRYYLSVLVHRLEERLVVLAAGEAYVGR